MKKLIFSVCLCIGLTVPAIAQKTYKGPKNKLDVYLLIGQSNMAGRAPFTKKEAKPIKNCFLLNGDNKWEPATNPLNRYSTIRKDLKMQKMNPGYYFAITMLKKNPKISIGLVVNAKGGTTIGQWRPKGNFYKDAIKRTKEAMKTGTLKGILWHQGESSRTDKKYLQKLEKLIEALRKDLGKPKLPFVAGQINNFKEFNDRIAKLPEQVPNTGLVKSEGLTAMDNWHFDAKSMKLMGERYAEEMLKLQKKSKK